MTVKPEPVPYMPEGPQLLIRETPSATPYPLDALGPLKVAAEAIASVTEAPIALCGASVLAVAALAAQGLRDVETLGGARPVSLFLLTVAESGERKSTVDALAMKGVRAFEASLRAEYNFARDAWRRDHDIWEKRRASILKGANAEVDATRADLDSLGPEPNPPLRPNVIASSVTTEGIVKNLPELRASLGVMTDEGGLILGGHSMKAETRLATLATFAAMWDGSLLDRWRAGDGVSAYVGRRFSAHLLIQPAAVEGFLSDPLASGQGLLARFLLSRPESRIGTRLRMTKDAEAEAIIDRFAVRIEDLLSRPLALAEGRRNELVLPVLVLGAEARAVLVEFARTVEREQAGGGAFEEGRAFASKLAEHATRIAGVMAIFADTDAEIVTGETMANAVTLATFLQTRPSGSLRPP